MEHARAVGSAVENQGSTSVSQAPGRGEWVRALRLADVPRLWAELHRVVCSHPTVRASYSAGLFDEGARYENSDLTQELFVQLLAKKRFQHYLDADMTDAEIEREISQIELSNLLTVELCKRYPESYRLARRISKLIQSSASFQRFDPPGAGTHQRLVNQLYGLREWPADKARRPLHEVEDRVQQLPICQRDTRVVGRTGDVQIIISNAELETLIVRVLEVLDTPVDVRNLRKFVLSRLSVLDIYLVPLNGGSSDDDEKWKSFEPIDGRANPEQALLGREAEALAAAAVEQFFQGLYKVVRGKHERYELMLRILWHFYLTPEPQTTQLAAAAQMGVSDTLIYNYRRHIDRQLRALDFSEIGPARHFEVALRERVGVLIGQAESAHFAVGA